MKKVLISACLIGDKVRYDGGDCLNPHIEELMAHFELVPFCPEVEGGLPIPRKRAEIRRGRVYDIDEREVTRYFLNGAEKALNICRYLNIELAIFKDGSPSCGSSAIARGRFDGVKIKGQGLTTALLRKNGVEVINEEEIPALLEKISNKKDAGK